ncbi:MAG: outer membrane protein assembly factor BamE [Pseudomonadota bacterium]
MIGMKTGLRLLVAGTILGLAGCAGVVRTHGYAPLDEQVAEIQVGIDTRGSVRRKIGRPGADGVFTNDGWYYVATQIEHKTYNDPKVISRRIVAVTFDDTDIVNGVNFYGLEDGRVIDLQTRTTPTFGRQLTVLQQILGNIGNITGDQILGGN